MSSTTRSTESLPPIPTILTARARRRARNRIYYSGARRLNRTLRYRACSSKLGNILHIQLSKSNYMPSIQLQSPSSIPTTMIKASRQAPGRISARARYNSNFLDRLARLLETDPECDLSKSLQKYSQKRLLDLQGTTDSPPPAPELCRTRNEIPIVPKPEGCLEWLDVPDQSIQNLVAQPRDTGFDINEAALSGLMQRGEICHHDRFSSRWIIKITDSIVVKCGPSVDVSELSTMRLVSKYDIPIPKPLGAIRAGTWTYLFMSHVPGRPLKNLWGELSSDAKSSMRIQLGNIIRRLRDIPEPYTYLGGGEPPRCKDLRRTLRISNSNIADEAAFNDFLLCTGRVHNPVYLELIRSTMNKTHQIVMTHGDLHPGNIMVTRDTQGDFTIAAILDWEMSGMYPEYWEFIKAMSGVSHDLSDWYSYIPAELGQYNAEWQQDSLISRLGS
ncbi:kinase-like domain-containing protein [Xylariomycetidae sp. FL2044]|nr:kinase-like domain-containing protein [Xylariomycetidae sp. FL2044]